MKRVLPFFLTFAVGLFIASFFVTVAAPTFQFNKRNWRNNHRQYDRQREAEIQRLREENMRLRKEAQQRYDNVSATFKMDKNGNVDHVEKMEVDGRAVDSFVPPVAPAPPTVYRDR